MKKIAKLKKFKKNNLKRFTLDEMIACPEFGILTHEQMACKKAGTDVYALSYQNHEVNNTFQTPVNTTFGTHTPLDIANKDIHTGTGLSYDSAIDINSAQDYSMMPQQTKNGLLTPLAPYNPAMPQAVQTIFTGMGNQANTEVQSLVTPTPSETKQTLAALLAKPQSLAASAIDNSGQITHITSTATEEAMIIKPQAPAVKPPTIEQALTSLWDYKHTISSTEARYLLSTNAPKTDFSGFITHYLVNLGLVDKAANFSTAELANMPAFNRKHGHTLQSVQGADQDNFSPKIGDIVVWAATAPQSIARSGVGVVSSFEGKTCFLVTSVNPETGMVDVGRYPTQTTSDMAKFGWISYYRPIIKEASSIIPVGPTAIITKTAIKPPAPSVVTSNKLNDLTPPSLVPSQSGGSGLTLETGALQSTIDDVIQQSFYNNSPNMKTAAFAIKYPDIATQIGFYIKDSTNITTNAVRFSTCNKILTENKTDKEEHKGSQVNAFRHALWQAAITKKFGENIAQQVGAAHETNATIELSQRTFKTMVEADQVIDLLNNQIGRQIGKENTQETMQGLAIKTLHYFAEKGLYIATKLKDGNIDIGQLKVPTEQYNSLLKSFQQLNADGFTKEKLQELDREAERKINLINNGPKN